MNLTSSFILISLGLFFSSWLAYDLMVVLVWRPEGKPVNTITRDIQTASSKSIAFPFCGGLLLGLLLGHLFLQF